MKIPMIAGASALLALSLGACSNASEPVHGTPELPLAMEQAEDAKLAAVLIYADWCGSCKTLDPKLDAVKSANTFEATSFVTLDYTAKDEATFYSAADAAGVEKAVRDYLGDSVKTGQLLLVDLDDQSVIGVVKKDMDEAAIKTTITTAAAVA